MALPHVPLHRRERVLTAAAVAIAAHVVLLPFIAKDAVFHMPPQRRRMQVSLASSRSAAPSSRPRDALQTPSANSPTVPQKTPEQQKKDEEEELARLEKLQGQIVSLGQPQDERAPTQPTKYLSEKDSRVLKETRAKETSAFYKNALSKVQKEGRDEKREAPQPAEAKPATAAKGQGGKAGVAEKKAQAAELPTRARKDRMDLPVAPDGTVQNRAAGDAMNGGGRKLAMARPEEKGALGEATPGVNGLTPGAPGLDKLPLNLKLNDASMGPVAGGPMPDDLKGVDEGDETLLNSRAFKFAGYLNRVKETVGRIWSSQVQDAASRRDPSGHLYSYKDRRTVVEFTLDKQGEIRDVKVSSSSGVDYLDMVAVDAFKKAERFPNPPPGLVGDNGVVTLPFAFTLLATQGGFRMQMGPAYLPNSPAQRGY